ncbi:MAG TPA: DUF4175 domain-containing protein [Saprospiraceae bacterium]|nr:DUF4175 domain-containing protein [Saprospiraceae bacterium]
MDQRQNNYSLLLQKLDRFIRKYYFNKIIKGSLYFLALTLALFLIFNFIEDQLYLSKTGRKFLFYGFIGSFFTAIWFWVLNPLLKYFRLGRTISNEQAAIIIGNHFSDVRDKLLNILHLQKQHLEQEDNELILAGIDQKSQSINPIPFRKAIDLKKNKKYLQYVIPPALILLFILLTAPGMITKSTERIIQNDKDFEREAGFRFTLKEDTYRVIQYQDLSIDILVEGNELPHEAFVIINGYEYRLKKESADKFSYTFKNLHQHTEFVLSAGNVRSKSYKIEVYPKPDLSQLEIKLDYPGYTGMKDELIRNNGDLLVPVGTKATWNIQADHADKLVFRFDQEKKRYMVKKVDDNIFSFQKTLKDDSFYALLISSRYIRTPDSIQYKISIIPDKYPEIDLETFNDPQNNGTFFAGIATDDYGISLLKFNYYIIDEQGVAGQLKSIEISRPKQNNRMLEYKHFFDVEKISLQPGETVHYYLEVFDNDAVNGSKSTRTGIMQYSKPSIEALQKIDQQNDRDIKKDMMSSLEKIKKLRDDIRKNKEKILQKDELEWKDKKSLEKLAEQQKELEKLIKEAKEKYDQSLQNQEQFRQEQETIEQKQEQLQKMFDEVLSDENKDLMQKIQELMQELQKEDMLKMMEDFEMDNETLEKQMERLLELFKQLELEKNIMDQVDKLNELAEKQEKLAEETKNEEKPNSELKKEQQEINKEFDKLEKEMEDIMKKNEKLKPPKDLAKDNEEKMEEISEDLEKSEDSLEKNSNSNASKSQSAASQKMKKMASSLEMQMQASEEEQKEEDLAALRQLLKNILNLSFRQEKLMEEVSESNPLTPHFRSLTKRQNDVKRDFKLVEDSLQALALRVTEIQSFVINKVTEINHDLDKSVRNMEGLDVQNNPLLANSDHIAEAGRFQRSGMKNLNDLALMLDESMQQMQQNMAIPGGSCDKPGNSKKPGKKGKEPSDKISKGQESLNEKLKGMQKALTEGKAGTAKEFAEAAARQAALRKALEDMKKSLQEEGKGGGNELQKMIDEMNKTEIDLVNKRLDGELLKRQQNLLTRLLEAEKADRQREFDDKRESRTAGEVERKLPPALEEYLKKRASEVDMYKTVSPSLNPFYKNLVDEYYKTIKSVN